MRGLPRKGEACIAVRSHFLALLTVRADSSDVGHANARLARHIRPDVPRVGKRKHGLAANLVHMVHPGAFRVERCFYGHSVTAPQKAQAIGNPIDMRTTVKPRYVRGPIVPPIQ